jgi:serine/threonine protein phosphatase PrpC
LDADECGFLILASDGVWDEMSTRDAVRIVARHLTKARVRWA